MMRVLVKVVGYMELVSIHKTQCITMIPASDRSVCSWKCSLKHYQNHGF